MIWDPCVWIFRRHRHIALHGHRGVDAADRRAGGAVELSVEQIARLNDLTPATGERHDEANMASIDR
jgi:hypothetical protein